jgi:hypothetical protein
MISQNIDPSSLDTLSIYTNSLNPSNAEEEFYPKMCYIISDIRTILTAEIFDILHLRDQ